jgi:hypothetical protein
MIAQRENTAADKMSALPASRARQKTADKMSALAA